MKFLSQINVNTEYTLPIVDGTNGQVLTTDGSGAVYWGSVSIGALNLDGLQDVVITTPTSGQILRYGIPVGSEDPNPVWYNWTPNFVTTANAVTITGTQTITGSKTFTAATTMSIASGSDVALTITKGGNGEGLIVNKTSGSGNAVTITGTLQATTIVKTGGTASQFLKADGSVDTNTYLTAHPAIANGGSVNNSLGTVVQDITVDANGHVTAIGSVNLDTRYYTQDDIAALFGGDTAIAGYNLINWDTAYGWGNHATAGYLTSFTETDPTVPAHVKSITATNISNWNDAFNDSIRSAAFNTSNGVLTLTQVDLGTVTVDLDGRYLQTFTETDPTVPAHVKAITSTQIGDWDRAYNWGDHSQYGYATQTYVNTAIANLVDSAPSTLDTLNELAAALGNDQNFATNVTNSIATKLPLAGGTMTGALNIDYSNAYLYIRSAVSGSFIQWHDQMWLGRYDNIQTQLQFPNYLPGGAYGLHVTKSSDAFFAGLISRGAEYNDFNAVIAWGDDAADVLQYRFNNAVVATLSETGSFNASNLTINSAQVATESWVTSQGYLTSYQNNYISDVRLQESTLEFTGQGSAFTGNIDLSTLPFQPVGSYLTAEADTLATVVARGSTTSSTISVVETTAGGFLFRTNSGWGSWARNGFSFANGSGTVMKSLGAYGDTGTSLGYMYLGTDYLTNTFRIYNDYVYVPGLDLAMSNSNGSHGAGTYFRGSSSHFVLGLNDGNTLYLNYGNGGGTLRTYGTWYHHDVQILSTSRVLTNVSGNISMFTNDSGYITGYTEIDTLATVTGRGASTSTAVNFGANGGAVNLTGLGSHISFKDQDNVWTGYVGFDGNTGRLEFPGRNVRIVSGYNGTIELNNGTADYNSGTVSIPWGNLSVGAGKIYSGNKNAIDGSSDSWLRLNNVGDYASGVYTPYILRNDGEFINYGGIYGYNTIRARKAQTVNNYTTAALWTESYDATTTGIAFHISGNVGKFLEMRTDGVLYWENQPVIFGGNIGSQSVATSTQTYRAIIEDTRSGQKTPNDYDDYRASWEFTNQIPGLSGSTWWSLMTVQGWHNGYAAWQIIGPSDAGPENWYLRVGNNTTWGTARRIWHSGDFSSTNVTNWNTAYGWGNHASAGYLTSLPSHNHDDRYYTESESDSRYFIKSGSWLGDLAGYGYTREVGIQMTGGSEFVILSKAGQGYTLVDGSYLAYEAGGFYSSNNSAGNTLLGFYADTASSVNFNTLNVKANGNTIWHAGNDGSGSGLDADLLDGQHGSYYQAASTAITTSNIGSQSVAYAGESGFVSNQGGQLLRFDNRTISPSETNAGYLQFGFTSWGNNNTSPWADYLHMRSYTDSSGGSDNLVMFKKSGIGMRIWQQSWGSSTAYSSYADVWTTENFSSTNVTNWNTAYGWGNHADASYIKADSTEPLTIQAETVTFTGNVTVEGTFTESSSIRFKENITPLDPALDKVNQLEAVSYNKIGVDDREIGLIAEDVAELFPEVVTYNEEGQPQGLNYSRLAVVLIKAVQELSAELNQLKSGK